MSVTPSIEFRLIPKETILTEQTNEQAETETESAAQEQAKVTFEDLGLNPKILQAVTEAGYTHATPIQEQAIPHILVGGDVTGIA